MSQTRNDSPRIAALRRSLKAGDGAALTRFWQEVRNQGTPLVEPLPDDAQHVLVTFLWQGAPDVENVVVISTCLTTVPSENRLRRLPDTDVWHKTYRLPRDLHFSYRLIVNDPLATARSLKPEQASARIVAGQTDPLNQHPLPVWLGEASMASLPDAPPQPWSSPRPDVPHGELQEHTLHSAILDNDRQILVYTPPGYAPDREPYGLLLLFDGQFYDSTIPAPTILDNLLAAGAIPPMVALLVHCVDNPTRMRELSCHAPFVEFLTDELLPWARERLHLDTDPARTWVGGVSLGGLAAAHAALCRPDLFGNVLSQSGSFWWSFADPEWLTRQFVHTERLPLRFYLEAGSMENRMPDTISLLQANRHLRDVLEAKGYDVQYRESTGGHDFAWWRGTLADGLIALAGEATRESRGQIADAAG